MKTFYAIKSKHGYLLHEDSWDYSRELREAFLFKSKTVANMNIQRAISIREKSQFEMTKEWIVKIEMRVVGKV